MIKRVVYNRSVGDFIVEKEFLLEKMTWRMVEEALKETDIVLLPTGSTENHGPHLPLQTDSYIAFEVAKRTAQKVSSEFRVLVAPALTIGCSAEHRDFPGTMFLRHETYFNVIVDVIRSLASHGFKKIIIVNGHGGNKPMIQAAILKLRDEDELTVGLTNWLSLVPEKVRGGHAGEVETSMIMAIYPDLVRKDRLTGEIVKTSPRSISGVTFPFPRTKTVSKPGYFGNPVDSNIEEGEDILEGASSKFADYLREVKRSGSLKGSNP